MRSSKKSLISLLFMAYAVDRSHEHCLEINQLRLNDSSKCNQSQRLNVMLIIDNVDRSSRFENEYSRLTLMLDDFIRSDLNIAEDGTHLGGLWVGNTDVTLISPVTWSSHRVNQMISDIKNKRLEKWTRHVSSGSAMANALSLSIAMLRVHAAVNNRTHVENAIIVISTGLFRSHEFPLVFSSSQSVRQFSHLFTVIGFGSPVTHVLKIISNCPDYTQELISLARILKQISDLQCA